MKTIYCGECEKFLYEDIEGYGICGKTKEVCYCGDKCHLTREAMTHYDYDLCCNEQCPKRLNCQRYMTYKNGGWEHCYVIHGCIDFQLLKQITK